MLNVRVISLQDFVEREFVFGRVCKSLRNHPKSDEIVSAILKCLQILPGARITPEKLLEHRLFKKNYDSTRVTPEKDGFALNIPLIDDKTKHDPSADYSHFQKLLNLPASEQYSQRSVVFGENTLNLPHQFGQSICQILRPQQQMSITHHASEQIQLPGSSQHDQLSYPRIHTPQIDTPPHE